MNTDDPFLKGSEHRPPLPASEWDSTPAGYPKQCAHELFEEQAARTPQAIALSFEDQRITYAELDAMADVVARRLRELGVGPEVIVAICMERSVAMVAGVLGILKAGGAYLPLDPSHPIERLAFIVEDSRAGLVLTEGNVGKKVFADGIRVVYFDGQSVSGEMDADPRPVAHTAGPDPHHPAYVIYTSGSTGKPKGVVMPHGALVNLLNWHLLALPGVRRTLQFASLSFDVSFQEIFSTWAAGGTLVLISDNQRRDPKALWNFIVEEKIERLFLPFVALQQLAIAASDAHAPELREIITAGEQLRISPKIAGFFEKNSACALHNHYGPTESHVVTAFSLRGAARDWPALPPIGKPITNAVIHILDERLLPVAEGDAGEIHISGVCLARGYLNRPALTAQRFVEHQGTRLYKTGDIGRLLPGGDIEFLGRSDDQVKIRGHRVELAEIEAVMLRHPSVSQCVVAATPNTDSGDRLAAYLVLEAGSTVACSDVLSDFLKKELPEYMIPSTFAQLDSLPFTPTGKIDRRALPLPGSEHFLSMPRRQAGETFVPPTNGVEAELVRIWEEVLDVRPIGIRENFFDLGGHSLLAAMVSQEIAKKFTTPVSLVTIFRAPTVEKLAIALNNGAAVDEDSSLEKIRVTGSRTPFFCIPGLFDLARFLGPDQPFYGLQMPQFEEAPDKWPSVEEIAAGCIQKIRGAQPNGPYCVGGFSFGGVVAFEIAHQLEALGEEISLLILIDPDPPRPFRTSGFDFYLTRLLFHGRKITRLNPLDQFRYFVDRLRKRRAPAVSRSWNIGYTDVELAIYLLHTEAVHARYQIPQFSGPAILFLAQDTIWRARPEKDPRLNWSKVIGGKLETYETPGDHSTVIREPNVRILAQRLSRCLEKAGSVIVLLLFCWPLNLEWF